MSITQLISELEHLPSASDPGNFSAEADAFLNEDLPALIGEVNAWAGQANALALEVAAHASNAAASAAAAASEATTVAIGQVVTLAPGEEATVANVGTATDVVLDFGIPGQPTDVAYVDGVPTSGRLAVFADAVTLGDSGAVLGVANAGDVPTRAHADSRYVMGAGAVTDNALIRADGTTGRAMQNSNAILADGGQLALTCPTGTLSLTPGWANLTLSSTTAAGANEGPGIQFVAPSGNVVGPTAYSYGYIRALKNNVVAGDYSTSIVLGAISVAGGHAPVVTASPTSANFPGTLNVTSTATAANFTTAAGGLVAFSGRGGLTAPSDGILRMSNAAAAGFTMLQFGGGTSSFAALSSNGADLYARKADGSGNTDFYALNLRAVAASGSSSVQIEAPAGNSRVLHFRTASAGSRFSVYADSVAEGGSNAGSNLQIGRYSDAGALIENVLTIERSTGNTTIARNLTVGGNLIVQGDTVTMNVATLDVEDAVIRCGINNATGTLPAMGLRLERGSAGDDAYIGWRESDDSFILGTVTSDTLEGFNTASYTVIAGKYRSTVSTGTAPLQVESTTKVVNLNVDLLDDQSGAYYLDLANATGTLAPTRIADSSLGISKISNIPSACLLGRISGGAGAVEELSPPSAKLLLSLGKEDVGLGNVDNTSDYEKPISTATQAALDGKQPRGTYVSSSTKVGDYTLEIVDIGALVRVNHSSPVNLTVPPQSSVAWPDNARIDVFQLSAGSPVTFVEGAGVEIVSYADRFQTAGRGAFASLVRLSEDVWGLSGTLS